MSKIRVVKNLPKVDTKSTLNDLHKVMVKQTLDKMRVWVTASTDVIPVWSGASRATFLEAAALAQTVVDINPIAESRIPLGKGLTSTTFFAVPGAEYGWEWNTALSYIDIVDRRVQFVKAGLKAIEDKPTELPRIRFKKA